MSNTRYREGFYAKYTAIQKQRWLNGHPDSIWERAVLYRMRKWLPDDKAVRVLDLGCGPGILLTALQSVGFKHLYGVDLNSEAVRIARARHACVEQGDVRDYLRSITERFDLIFAFDLVEHFTK